MLRKTLEASEVSPLGGGVDEVYRLITDDEVSSGRRQEVKSQLEQNGIDIESLQGEFVSYQSIRTYLRNYRNVEPPDKTLSAKELRQSKQSIIQRLKSRLSTVTTGALRDIRRAGYLTLGGFEVTVTVRIHCSDCDTRMSVNDLLDDGSCHCDI
jgi:hypothetical protein